MEDSYQGYVVYGIKGEKYLPIGIISPDYKRQTISSKVPSKIISGLIAIEDKRFFNHSGLDYRGIARAVRNNIKMGRIVEGGSTITQQLARNLLFDFDKTIARKIKEAIYSLYLEHKYSKEEILSLYFEKIYWGKNIYGLRAASIYYFSKEPYKLSEQEQIMLLTLLRGPNLYGNNSSMSLDRYKLLNEILYKNKVINSTHYYRNISRPPTFQRTELAVLDRSLVQYIANNINTNKGSIKSSINIELQKILSEFARTAPFPMSIVAIEKGKICAVASTFGSNHPVIFKANVGSTLKPFLYQFLRESGINQDEQFNSVKNNLGWNVREATTPANQYMTLKQGLLASNNNVFINAAAKIGLDKTLDYLSRKLSLDKNEIFPSTILGATASGISLVDLALLYNNHFSSPTNSYTSELYSILNQNAILKFGRYFGKNIFLKTGTTNESKECYVVLGNSKLVIAAIRNKDNIPNDGKDTTLITHIRRRGKKMLKYLFSKGTENKYTWQ